MQGTGFAGPGKHGRPIRSIDNSRWGRRGRTTMARLARVGFLPALRVDGRSEGRVPRELGVGQSGIAEKSPIRANRIRGKEFHRARSSDKVVLIHAVAADADGADQFAVPIERESTRENGDAVGQVWIRCERLRSVGGE